MQKQKQYHARSLFLGSGGCSSSLGPRLLPILLGSGEVARVGLLYIVLVQVQRGAALGTTRVLSIDLGTLLGLLPTLPLVHDVYHALWGQILQF